MRDYIFKRLLFLCSLLVLLICGSMVYSLVSGALPAFHQFGFLKFISTADWNPTSGQEQYGALTFINGRDSTSDADRFRKYGYQLGSFTSNQCGTTFDLGIL